MVNRYLAERDDLNTVIHDQIDTVSEAQMPLGYLVPAAWTGVVGPARTARRGDGEDREARIEQEFETYRFSNIKFAGSSNEGHVAVSFDAKPVKEKNSHAGGLVLGAAEATSRAPGHGDAGAAGARFAGAMGPDEFGVRDRIRWQEWANTFRSRSHDA